MTVVRSAVPSDREQLVTMGLQFLASSRYGEVFTGATRETIDGLLEWVAALGVHGQTYVAADGDELLGAIVLAHTPHPFTGVFYVEEIAWWVQPSRRGILRIGPQLLAAAEDWCLQMGASMLKMGAPVPSPVGRFYERHGYEAVETAYIKRF